MFLTIVVVLLIISFLVTIHEFGHYITALKCGMRVEEFSIGMGPALFKHTSKKTNILYSVRCLPIGGYCKIKGEEKGQLSSDNLSEEINKVTKEIQELEETLNNTTNIEDREREKTEKTIAFLKEFKSGLEAKLAEQNNSTEDNSDAFCNKKPWQRGIVLCAGVTMNFIFAIIFMYICLLIGMPAATDKQATEYPHAKISDTYYSVVNVLESSSAYGKIEPGDRVIAVNSNNFDNITLEEILNSEDSDIKSFTVKKKDGSIKEYTDIVKTYNEAYDKEIYGMAFNQISKISYGPLRAIPETFKVLGNVTVEMFKALGRMVGNIFTGKGLPEELSGPVGITVVTGEAIHLGFSYLLFIIAQLSLNLAIINILPFPALDGGRVLFLIIEKIKGKPLNEKFEIIANGIGFLLLMILILCVTCKDIKDYIIK